MRRAEWLSQVKLLAGLWPNQPLPGETIDEWEKVLADFPAAAVESGIRHLAKTATMRPSLAELVKGARASLRDERLYIAPLAALPEASVRESMAASRRPYVVLLTRLYRLFEAKRIPSEDYFKLTTERPGMFHNGQATGMAVMELQNYVEVAEMPPAVQEAL